LEASWILTNLAYGKDDEIEDIFSSKYDVLSALNNLMKEGSDLQLIEQFLWFFANCCGDSSRYRDSILQKTDVLSVLSQLTTHSSVPASLLKAMCWLCSNISRHGKLNVDQMQQLIQVASCGFHTENNEIISDCTWVISYLADTPDDNVIDMVASGETLPLLI
jgi:importin subunit alpha-6/7